MASENYFYGLGRRKTSTASARLYANGKGTITVNEQSAEDYFAKSEYLLADLVTPLQLLEKAKSFNVSLHVNGGGHQSQVGACKLAISKALADIDDGNRGTLKKAGLLKRDSREKERKKYGLKRARKSEQYTKR